MSSIIGFAKFGEAMWSRKSHYFGVLLEDVIAVADDGTGLASILEDKIAVGCVAFDELDRDVARSLFVAMKRIAEAVVNDITLPGMTWKEKMAGDDQEDHRRSMVDLLELMARYEPSIMCHETPDRSLIPVVLSLEGFKQSTWWTWGHYFDVLVTDLVGVTGNDSQVVAHLERWKGTDNRGFSYTDRDFARRVFATLKRVVSAVVDDATLSGMSWKEKLANDTYADYRQSLAALLTLLTRYEPSIMTLSDDQDRLLTPAVVSVTGAEESTLWTRACFLDILLADVMAAASDSQDLSSLAISARYNCLDFSLLHIGFARRSFICLKRVVIAVSSDEAIPGMTWNRQLEKKLHGEYRHFATELLNILTRHEQTLLPSPVD